VRALVTGAAGFVGRYLAAALESEGCEVVAPPLELRDPPSLHAAFDIAAPDTVFHLAAQTFVPRSIEAPAETYEINAIGTANLLACLRAWRDRTKRNARVVYVSSAEVYGARAPDAMPLHESLAPNPANPYAASKAAAEALVLGEVHSFGVDAVIARAFNHIGPGQDERFAVPAFAAQLCRIAAGAERILQVGNLDARRDFLDVRDVVDAYVQLAHAGTPGEIYNVCSGSAISLREVLGELIRIAHVPVEVRTDPQRMRPADVALLYGSNQKLRAATGWTPRYALGQTLQDVYDSFHNPSTLLRMTKK
jgi:GDP-4-dehydro-6-deoxy-D-mannose reductase